MSVEIFENRQNKLKAVLAEQGLDGILISRLSNVRYICGFTGSAGSCILTPNDNYFITDGRYMEQSKNEVKGFKRFIDYGTHIEIAQKNNLIPNGLKLAFESEFLSYNSYSQLTELFPDVKWESTKMILENLAAVKDESELEALRIAVKITDKVFDEVLQFFKIGISEKEIALELAMRYRKYGEGEAFASIVASGPNSALPHAQPGERKLKQGDFVVVDAAAKYAGYHADMTRTVVIGEATEKHHEMYEIVKQSQQAGIDAAQVGVACKTVDDATRNIIANAGYGDKYIHSAGHGIGLEIHAYPRLSQQSEEILKENNVVTIEPGVYLTGWGGVRIEDDILVKNDGNEVLNKTSKELMILN
ncbi:Xaa-Pro peptidase family protein [bacterium]|nr:Xaa-Pro peptidase family protein [bacterium]